MKKWSPLLIMLLVGISSICLIVIQLLGIKSAIKTENSLFKLNISEAVENINNYLEYYELTNYFVENKKGRIGLKQIHLLNGKFFVPALNSDSINDFCYKPEKGQIGNDSFDVQEMLRKSIYVKTRQTFLLKHKKTYLQYSETVEKFIEDALTNLSLFSVKTKLDITLLDSIICKELKTKGIEISFVYGIYAVAEKRIIHINDSNYKKQILTSGIKYQLYPSNIMGSKKNMLFFYFPNKGQMIYKGNVWFITCSILFILIILSVLVYLFKRIYVQKKLSEIKNDFINNLTHEIKTPISTIALVSEMLSDENIPSDKENRKKHVQIIKDENKRLQLLTEQILLMAKIENKRLRIEHDPVDIHDLINSCIETMKFPIEQKGGTISTRLCAKDAVIYCDKMHVSNIIQNLLDNAGKYGGEKPVIEISTHNLFKGIEIVVKDNGIGISKEERTIIFEKFYRVSTGNVHNVKGYGIGLSYVKQIVDMHKGSIRVESELQQGSSFIIFLPKGSA